MSQLNSATTVHVVATPFIAASALARLLRSVGWTVGHPFASVAGLADVKVSDHDVIVIVESSPGYLAGATTQKVVSTLRWVFPSVAIVVVANAHDTVVDHDARLIVLTRGVALVEVGQAITLLSGANTAPRPLLSTRPRQILQLIANGLTPEEVCEHLGVAPKTVTNHLTTVYQRLGTHNLVQSVLKAIHFGLIELGDSRERESR